MVFVDVVSNPVFTTEVLEGKTVVTQGLVELDRTAEEDSISDLVLTIVSVT